MVGHCKKKDIKNSNTTQFVYIILIRNDYCTNVQILRIEVDLMLVEECKYLELSC